MQKLGHAAGTVSSTSLSTLPTCAEAGVRGEYKPALPPQVSPRLSTRLYLVPRMKRCEFLDLIPEVIQPLPILTLKGVQFGQTRLHWYSHSVWCPGRGCSPVVIFVDWCISA